jgi:predicted dehydrogenase
MGVYHIAQVLYLLGCPAVERVSGRVYQETGMDEKRRRESGYSVEELGLGLARLAGGVTLDIVESWAIHLNGFDGSCVVGSAGGLRLSPLSYHTTTDEIEVNQTFESDLSLNRWRTISPEGSAYDGAQPHWIAALQGKVPLLPTAEVALATMLVSEGIYLSDKLGREVTAEEVSQSSRSTALSL